ncbi:MAG: FkbM family methyltransferase [Verrucomicrobiota bacterium JB024]|nr:FkbM family methyltransferase [Verrucomicrobiota bacterium JB024]
MPSLKRLLETLTGREENIFAGLYFMLCKRRYRADFGTFRIPRRWSRPHFHARFLNDGYETEERALVARHLGPGDHVLELGACVGVVSTLTARRIQGGRHCVIEANPYLIPTLTENRDHNDAHFQIVAGAVTEEPSLTFYLNRNIVGGSAERKTGRASRVAGYPLDFVCGRFGPFNTLIMDIEGGESAFIRGYREQLRAFSKLVIEFHPGILGAEEVSVLAGILEELGFRRRESIGDVDFWAKADAGSE